jgi:hypothetical protein
VRREQEAKARLARGTKSGEQIRAAGLDILEVHIQTGLGGGGGEKIGDPALAGARMAGGQKRRVHAGQRDQLTQQFFGISHSTGNIK